MVSVLLAKKHHFPQVNMLFMSLHKMSNEHGSINWIRFMIFKSVRISHSKRRIIPSSALTLVFRCF